MKDNPFDELNDKLNAEMAGHLVLAAQVQTLQSALEVLFSRLEMNEIDGLSLSSWAEKKKNEYLQELLIGLEKINPALAAHLQQKIDGERP